MISGKYIGSGDLRETVLIESASETPSATGAPVPSWSTVRSTRAKVEPIRGMESARLQQAQAMVDYRVWVRKSSTAIQPQMRLTWDSRVMDIQSVIEHGAEGRFLELMCKERMAPDV